MHKAIFLDRDGVVNVDKGYVCKLEDFEPIDKNIEFIKKLNSNNGYLVFIITNQAGIARGYYTEEEFLEFEKLVEEYLKKQGIDIEKTYYCPHHPEGIVKKYAIVCDCRKPKIGMIMKASKEYNIDLKNSFVIGDKNTDIEAGIAAGCKTLKI